MKLFNVEVQVKVRADDEDEAWRRVHDYMAATITGPGEVTSDYVVDFDILDNAATEETEP
jgi:hypothetical protein